MSQSGRGGSTRLNVHVYQSTFVHESRMLKITKSLADRRVFDEILIIARHDSGLLQLESLDDHRSVRRVRTWIPARDGFVFKIGGTVEWMIRVALLLVFKRVACINCHSLMVLPLGVCVKFIRRAKLIYDTHELETETAKLGGSRKRLAKFTERAFIRFADETVVVGSAICRWYQDTYPGLSIRTVKNVPYASSLGGPLSEKDYFRERFAIANQEVIFLYQGALGVGRGVELLLDVFADLPESHHLVMMGYGRHEDLIQEASARHGNIHFHPAVAPSELSLFTRCADVGLCLIEPICLSYRLSLPNKLFEYLQAGIPVVTSNFAEMSTVVEGMNCGWTTAVERNSLVRLLAAINSGSMVSKLKGVAAAASDLCWEREEQVLVGLYSKHGFNPFDPKDQERRTQVAA